MIEIKFGDLIMASIYTGIPIESWIFGLLMALGAPAVLYYIIHYIRHGKFGEGDKESDYPIGFIIGIIEICIAVGLLIFYLLGGYFYSVLTFYDGMFFVFSIFGIPTGIITTLLTYKEVIYRLKK